jgi:hypothetical protein
LELVEVWEEEEGEGLGRGDAVLLDLRLPFFVGFFVLDLDYDFELGLLIVIDYLCSI